MALQPGVECRHEISTEAKICPNCGARNRAYKSKVTKFWLLVVLGLLALFYISYENYKDEKYYEDKKHQEQLDNVSNCDTPMHRASFVSVIDGSSYSQLNKLQVIDITNIKTIKSGDSITDLVCEATVDFNSQRKKKYRFSWRESESGALIIKAEEKQ